MKKLFTLLAMTAVQLFLVTPSYSAVYEASTLYNSVSRAETVQDLYMKRWDILKNENFYFDIYGKLNWVFNFDVNTYNAGTQKYEATDLRLTRTYGSMTLALPIGGFRQTADDRDFIVAFTTTGFHYGLAKDMDVERTNGGTESISDYKHPQFFDDIYAVSILFRPYVTFHGGYIINNQYVPEDDGTMDYYDPVESQKKKFVALELYKFMAFSMNIDNGKPETTKLAVGVNSGLGFFMDTTNIYFPVVTLGYERSAAYNDEIYDSVWVDDPKDITTAAYPKDSATLNVYSIKINQRFAEVFTIEGFLGAQYISDDIYTKTDQDKINVAKAKEWYLLLSYDPITAPEQLKLKIYTGVSWYWDPAIAIHREHQSNGNAVYGWIIGSSVESKNFGGEIMAEYNYSSELKKLMEAADKWAIEGSLFFRI